ncbi:hypothetical protein [Paraburkholderia aromaticivorans]|uniref:hypothetical protein n=1 Tax=Paraburkholderia aromaticivorans TaxID=2026199 RepID=UPI001455DEA0|nr:hypothetical protein [Paraburkholderia aromaticivorans]
MYFLSLLQQRRINIDAARRVNREPVVARHTRIDDRFNILARQHRHLCAEYVFTGWHIELHALTTSHLDHRLAIDAHRRDITCTEERAIARDEHGAIVPALRLLLIRHRATRRHLRRARTRWSGGALAQGHHSRTRHQLPHIALVIRLSELAPTQGALDFDINSPSSNSWLQIPAASWS